MPVGDRRADERDRHRHEQGRGNALAGDVAHDNGLPSVRSFDHLVEVAGNFLCRFHECVRLKAGGREGGVARRENAVLDVVPGVELTLHALLRGKSCLEPRDACIKRLDHVRERMRKAADLVASFCKGEVLEQLACKVALFAEVDLRELVRLFGDGCKRAHGPAHENGGHDPRDQEHAEDGGGNHKRLVQGRRGDHLLGNHGGDVPVIGPEVENRVVVGNGAFFRQSVRAASLGGRGENLDDVLGLGKWCAGRGEHLAPGGEDRDRGRFRKLQLLKGGGNLADGHELGLFIIPLALHGGLHEDHGLLLRQVPDSDQLGAGQIYAQGCENCRGFGGGVVAQKLPQGNPAIVGHVFSYQGLDPGIAQNGFRAAAHHHLDSVLAHALLHRLDHAGRGIRVQVDALQASGKIAHLLRIGNGVLRGVGDRFDVVDFDQLVDELHLLVKQQRCLGDAVFYRIAITEVNHRNGGKKTRDRHDGEESLAQI